MMSELTFVTLPEPRSKHILAITEWVFTTQMQYPNRTIAIAVAYALCFQFAGRKDSLHSNPPVLAMLIIARSTSGKDTFLKACQAVVDFFLANGWKEAAMFSPLSPALGAMQTVKGMLGTVSGVRVRSEAGVAGKSKAGDTANVQAMWLQNSAANAYTRLRAPALNDMPDLPWGVNILDVAESTLESYRDLIGGSAGSGEAGRRLFFAFDPRAVVNLGQFPSWEVTPEIHFIFHALIEEALRGEAETTIEVKGADGAVKEVGTGKWSDHPVPDHLKRRFVCDDVTGLALKKLYDNEFSYRQAKGITATDLEWTLSGRYLQLLMRLCLVVARTDNICEAAYVKAARKHQQATGVPAFARATEELSSTLVTEQHYLEARGILNATRQCEMANAGLHELPEEQLVAVMYKEAVRVLSEPTPSGTYKAKFSKKATEEDILAMFESKTMPRTYFTGGACQSVQKLASELAKAKGTTAVKMYEAAFAQGLSGDLWKLNCDMDNNKHVTSVQLHRLLK